MRVPFRGTNAAFAFTKEKGYTVNRYFTGSLRADVTSVYKGDKMYRVAIVEDEAGYREQVRDYIEKYGEEHHLTFEIVMYEDGREIVEDGEHVFDIIFFDIEMEEMNGMEAAGAIRQRDENVVIVFITNMAQYAIEGYSVGALDFVLKPIDYYGFSFRMTRALERVKKKETLEVMLQTATGIRRVDSGDIWYVEIDNRILYFHTNSGRYSMRGTMQKAEEMLRDYHFVKCNHWYLVNLKYVTEIQDNIVMVAGNPLEISRRNRTAFVRAVTDYIGGL